MKLRKAQEQLEEAELRASMAERRASLQAESVREKPSVGLRLRSTSFVREGSTFSLADYTPRRSRRTPAAYRSMESEEREIFNGSASVAAE